MPTSQTGTLTARDESLTLRPLLSASALKSEGSAFGLGLPLRAPREGADADGRPAAPAMPPPPRLTWGLPPAQAPAPPSYLKIIRLLGRRTQQTDAELSVTGSGGLAGGPSRQLSLQCPHPLRPGTEGRTGPSPAWRQQPQAAICLSGQRGRWWRSITVQRQRERLAPHLPHPGHLTALRCSHLLSRVGVSIAQA